MGLESATFINDLNSSNPDGTVDPKSQGDDHIKLIKAAIKATFPGMAGRYRRIQTSGVAFNAALTDNSSLVRLTAAVAVNLAAVAGIGNGWELLVYNNSTGNVTLTPNGAEKVNAQSSVIVPPEHIALVLAQNSAGIEYLAVVMPLLATYGAGADITGNITLAAADFNGGIRRVTNDAVVTLPAIAGVPVGRKLTIKSVTTKSVTVAPNGAETIDLINATIRVPSYCTLTLLCNGSDWVVADQSDYAVGDLKMVGVTIAAYKGWELADAGAILRATFSGLFAVTGTVHGAGDGSTTFNKFDSRGRALIGDGTGVGLTARTVGNQGGEETHILTVPEMPSHSHTTPTGNSDGPGAYAQQVQNPSGSSQTSSSTGGGGAHNNMQPFGVARYMVKT